MRHIETLPAWVARQRSRHLVRRRDEKIVRWINHSTSTKHEGVSGARTAEPSSNDNVVVFASGRSVQAS